MTRPIQPPAAGGAAARLKARAWPILRRLPFLLVSVWVTTTVLAYLGQRWLLYPTYLVSAPEGFAWNEVTWVEVPTADGETLKGFWRPPDAGGSVVVSFHGNGSLPEWHAERFAALPWSTHSWGMLAVAYRGYPGSTGSPDEAGLIQDGEAAVAYVRRHAPGAAILFHGHSLGSGVAVAMAARHPSKGLYLEAPYDSILAVAGYRALFLPTFLLRDTFRSDQRIGAVAARIFAVHGSTDDVIPIRFGRALMAHARPGATFVEIPGDHISILGTQDDVQEPLFRAAPETPPAKP